MPDHTVILTSGTRGDVQPLVAYALGMRATNHDAVLVTQPIFRSLIEERGLYFAPLAASPSDAFESAGQDALVLGRHPLRTLRATMRFMQLAQPLFASMLESAWQHAQGASQLILTLPTLVWGSSIAEALGIPCSAALLQPLCPTSAFPSPLLPFAADLGPANRASHRLTAQILWQPWRSAINRWRRRSLGLGSLPFAGPDLFSGQIAPLLYGHSPHILPAPPDWPKHAQVVGYWQLEHPQGWHAPAELEAFLAGGAATVYVGFGSMGLRRPDLPALLVGALRKLGLRAVLALGTALPPELRGSDMYEIDAIWHDWLFPRMVAAIHHGGAGTAGAAFRAAIPSIIAPIAVDQFFWARQFQRAGAGIDAGPLRQLTEERLIAALTAAITTR